MKPEMDYSLYLVTDRALAGERDFEDLVGRAIRGGCTLVQLREKEASSGEFYERALRLKKITDYFHVPLIIDDRIDIMLAVDAAGVHLGQSDLPAEAARQIIGPDKILGVSARTVEDAEKAESDGADYLGVGAVYPTTTKGDAEKVSREELEKICSTVSIPVVAIGGLNARNIPSLEGSGISGVAVVSAIMAQDRPEEAARLLKDTVYGIL
jgi:thiamine-phosphate diphosphorylase